MTKNKFISTKLTIVSIRTTPKVETIISIRASFSANFLPATHSWSPDKSLVWPSSIAIGLPSQPGKEDSIPPNREKIHNPATQIERIQNLSPSPLQHWRIFLRQSSSALHLSAISSNRGAIAYQTKHELFTTSLASDCKRSTLKRHTSPSRQRIYNTQ